MTSHSENHGMRTTPADSASSLCASLYPGGHGEDRTCVLPCGHSGPHVYEDERLKAVRVSVDGVPVIGGKIEERPLRFDLWPKTGRFETEPKS